jgi:hypothetical protein
MSQKQKPNTEFRFKLSQITLYFLWSVSIILSRDLLTSFGLMTGFIAHLYNLLLHFTDHNMTHYVFSSPSSSTADSRDSLHSNSSKVKVKVMLRPTVPSASPSWSKAPIWGLRPDLYYFGTVAGLLMWGALSDERTGLSFARLSNIRSFVSMYKFILQVIKCMNIQHIQGLCQFGLSTAENALLLAAPATIAV